VGLDVTPPWVARLRSIGARSIGGASIRGRMIAVNNRASGFDYLRILLAASIVCFHSVQASYGSQYELTIWHGPIGVLMHP
jgi:hypothetical protein